jgi:hemoglobin
LTEHDITAVVDAFYMKVRRDPVLGPVFARAIADDAWPAHLAIIQDFWSSVMLKTGRYRRNPFSAHVGFEGIGPELFDRWLALFKETCNEQLAAEPVKEAAQPKPKEDTGRDWEAAVYGRASHR